MPRECGETTTLAAIIFLILQMSKLRHVEVKLLGHRPDN